MRPLHTLSPPPLIPTHASTPSAHLTIEKSVHAICSVGTMTIAGNSLSPRLSRVIQNAADARKSGSVTYSSHPLNWLSPAAVARSSTASALEKRTDCVPTSAAKSA